MVFIKTEIDAAMTHSNRSKSNYPWIVVITNESFSHSIQYYLLPYRLHVHIINLSDLVLSVYGESNIL